MKRQQGRWLDDGTDEEAQWLDKIGQLDEEELMALLSNDDVFRNRVDGEADSRTIAAVKDRTFTRLGLAVEGGLETRKGLVERGLDVRNNTAPDVRDDAVHVEPEAGTDYVSTLRRGATRRNVAARWVAAAAIAGIVALGALIAGSPAVRAQIEKLMQYIPGYANIQEAPGDAPRYVLPKPVEVSGENGRMVQLRAVSIDRDLATIDLAGEGLSFPEQIVLENTAGAQFVLKRSMGLRATGDEGWKWTAFYWYQGEIAIPEDGKFVIRYEGLPEPIGFSLQPAKSVRNMEELGATVAKGGITLTAVVAEDGDDRQRITLLAQIPDGLRIQSYGIHPDPTVARTFLYTPTGERKTIVQDPAFPNANELILERDPAETGQYRLVVDGIDAVKKAEQATTVTLPVPKEGALDVNKSVTIAGYPVDIKSVERVRQPDLEYDSLLVYLDAHYQEDRPDNLMGFFPDADRNGKGGGAASQGDLKTGQIVKLWVDIDKDIKAYKMSVSEARIQINGPWEFVF